MMVLQDWQSHTYTHLIIVQLQHGMETVQVNTIEENSSVYSLIGMR